MKQPVYLAVHVPEFPAQALLRLQPDGLRKPTVVVKGTAPLQQVCSLNTVARSLGVHTGMTRAQLDTFQGVQVLPASVVEENRARTALLQAASAFTPQVELQARKGSAFSMVLDMSGMQWMLGSVEQATTRVQCSIQALGFTVWLAASSNIQAALCVACVPQNRPVIITPGKEAATLAPLPLAALHPDTDMAETFSLWGLRTLGELAALPLADVVARLGKEGRRLHDLARGVGSHLLQPEESAFLLEEKVEFDHPVEQLDSLLFALRPMLQQLIDCAGSRSYSLASVTTQLWLEGGAEHSRLIRPALPTLDQAALLKLVQLDLEAHPPCAGIKAVVVSAQPGDRMSVQGGFFAPQLPESARLDVTLARIAAMVGEQRVGRARLLDTHCEQGFAMEPFSAPDTTAGKAAVQHAKAIACRATRLSVRRCRPPVPLSVNTRQGCHAWHPLSFYLLGKKYTVYDALGPWRSSGEWWSAEAWSHEEWDVRAANTVSAMDCEVLLCVLRHDMLRNAWTFVGTYD